MNQGFLNPASHIILIYGVQQHHERAQRVTHSLEALDKGSGTEMRAEGPPAPLLTGDESMILILIMILLQLYARSRITL